MLFRSGLLEAALEALRAGTVELNLLVPYANGDVVARLHDAAEVLSLDHDQEGTVVTVLVPAADVRLYQEYVRS